MLAYDVAGSGPPIVLIHGAMSDRRIFGYQLLALSQRHRVIAVDLPGFCRSPWNPEEVWLEQAVEAVVEVIDSLKCDSPLVVGWSLGGLVARAVAERIALSRLVLVCVAADGVSEDVRAAMRRRLLADFPRFARGMVRSMTSSGVSQDTEDWVFDMAIATPVNVHVASLVDTAATLPQKLPADTVSLVGLRDQLVERRRAPRGVREIVFERSGHIPFLEESEKFNSVLSELAAT